LAQKEERMASIRKRNGKWHAQVRRANCKSITKTFTLKKYAERWARDMEQKLDRQELQIDHQEATLRDLVNRYLIEVVPLKRSNESEGIVLQSFLKEKFVDLSIYKINAEHFAKYRDRRLKIVKPATFVRQIGILQHLYNTAIKEWGFEFKNPVKSIRKPIIRNKRNRRLTDTECQQIVGGNYSHQLLRSIIELALETGMRRGELLRIQRDHIKDQTLLIPYAKNGESRIIPLTKRARQILDHASLPFPVSANGLRLAWQRLRKRFSIKDLHFHDLRHEAISRFFEKGLSVAEVALISGHKDVRMLFRYTHLKAEDIVGKIN
jgi:integrase